MRRQPNGFPDRAATAVLLSLLGVLLAGCGYQPNLFDAQGWWKLTVVSYDCPGFFDAGFDAQCRQYTKLSDDVRIQVKTPEESIINADWVCHWDCNTGLYVDAFRH